MPPTRVVFIGQANYFDAHWDTPYAMSAEFVDFAAVRDDPARLDRIGPADVFFVFRGEWIPPEKIAALRGIRVHISTEPMPRLMADNRTQISNDRAARMQELMAAKGFDFTFHHDHTSLSYLRQAGAPVNGEFVLPVALRKFSVSRRAPRWDVFYLGKQTSYRDHILDPIKHQLGNRFLHVAHGYDCHDIARVAGMTPLALNVHVDDLPALEPRLQIYAACGMCILSERLSHYDFFEPNKHFVPFDGPRDLREKIAYYLAHPEEARAIGKAALALVAEKLDARRVWADLANRVMTDHLKNLTPDKAGETA